MNTLQEELKKLSEEKLIALLRSPKVIEVAGLYESVMAELTSRMYGSVSESSLTTEEQQLYSKLKRLAFKTYHPDVFKDDGSLFQKYVSLFKKLDDLVL